MENNKKLFIKNLAIVLIVIASFIIFIKMSPVVSQVEESVPKDSGAETPAAEAPAPDLGAGAGDVAPDEPAPAEEPAAPAEEPAAPAEEPAAPAAETTNNTGTGGGSHSRPQTNTNTNTSPSTNTGTGGDTPTISETPTTQVNQKPTPPTTNSISNVTTNTNKPKPPSGGTSSTPTSEPPEPEEEPSTSTEPENNSSSSSGSVIVEEITQPISQPLAVVLERLPEPIQKNATRAVEQTTKVISSPEVATVTTAVASAGIISGASLSTSAILSMDSIILSDFFLGIIRLWGIIMTALGFRKKNKPWGSVYDSVTKQPLDPAYVQLQDMNGKEVSSAITDMDGRYGFLAPAGQYKLIAHKTNYEFPSKKASGKTVDEIYPDLYFGETVEISTDGGVINKNIPMDPMKFDWNEFEKTQKHLMKFYSKKNLIFMRIANILFALGLILTLVSVITVPRIYNIIILVVYLILYLAKNTVIKPRSFGTIVEKETGNPLSFAIIHIKKSSNEILHKVANKIGRFYCLIPNGNYEITIDKKNPDESYSEIFRQENFEVKNGLVNKKFEV